MGKPSYQTGMDMIPAKFPAADTCVVRPLGISDVFECLSRWGVHCPYTVLYERKRICCHSNAALGLIRRDPEP